jgi:hypothetical protein
MKIVIRILMVILGITVAACAIIGLYFFWFKAVPDLLIQIYGK